MVSSSSFVGAAAGGTLVDPEWVPDPEVDPEWVPDPDVDDPVLPPVLVEPVPVVHDDDGWVGYRPSYSDSSIAWHAALSRHIANSSPHLPSSSVLEA